MRPRTSSTRPRKRLTSRSIRSRAAPTWTTAPRRSCSTNLQEVAQRRLEVDKAKIEDEKLIRIREGKADSEQKTRAIENSVRFMAAVIPPLPPLILGLLVFVTRLRRENLGANPKRLA